jgi:hypothetical protein
MHSVRFTCTYGGCTVAGSCNCREAGVETRRPISATAADYVRQSAPRDSRGRVEDSLDGEPHRNLRQMSGILDREERSERFGQMR